MYGAWKTIRRTSCAMSLLRHGLPDRNIENRTPSAELSAIGRLHGTTKKDITCSMTKQRLEHYERGRQAWFNHEAWTYPRSGQKRRHKVIKRNKIGCNHKAKWYSCGNKHQKRRKARCDDQAWRAWYDDFSIRQEIAFFKTRQRYRTQQKEWRVQCNNPARLLLPGSDHYRGAREVWRNDRHGLCVSWLYKGSEH